MHSVVRTLTGRRGERFADRLSSNLWICALKMLTSIRLNDYSVDVRLGIRRQPLATRFVWLLGGRVRTEKTAHQATRKRDASLARGFRRAI